MANSDAHLMLSLKTRSGHVRWVDIKTNRSDLKRKITEAILSDGQDLMGYKLHINITTTTYDKRLKTEVKNTHEIKDELYPCSLVPPKVMAEYITSKHNL